MGKGWPICSLKVYSNTKHSMTLEHTIARVIEPSGKEMEKRESSCQRELRQIPVSLICFAVFYQEDDT